jgi:hypothetical protein
MHRMQAKPGWRTSEFWLTVVAALVPLLNQGLGWSLDTSSIVAIAGVAIGYAFSRGQTKKGTAIAAAAASAPVSVAIAVAFCLCLLGTARAGTFDRGALYSAKSITEAGVDVEPSPIPAPPVTSGNWGSYLFHELENASASHQINVDVAPLWAPKLSAAQKWGADLDINHPIGSYAAVGLRFRYFNGDTYAGGVGIGLKDTFQVDNLVTVQPYATVGELNSVKNGGGVQPIAFAETGAKIFFWQSKTSGVVDGRFQLFGLGGIEYDSNLAGVQIFRVGGGFTWNLGQKDRAATTH